MVLKEGGLSTWGWRQNSLFTIKDGEFIKNPEYYCVKHFSHFIKKGAKMLKIQGAHSTCSIAFKNPDKSIVIVTINPYNNDKILTVDGKNYILKPKSINTIVL
jgi:glucosylceramidase